MSGEKITRKEEPKISQSLKDEDIETIGETLTLQQDSNEPELETLKLEEGIELEPISLENIEQDQLELEYQLELHQQVLDDELEEKEMLEKSSKLIQEVDSIKKPFRIDDKELKSLYGRLNDFLPKIKEANKSLDKQ